MGIFEKVKNLFTDEVEDEVKTGMIQVEIPAPAKVEVKNEEEVTDSKIMEEKPAGPIFFDDDYFKELEHPKQETKSTYRKEKTIPIENTIFRPTPIISPVYGVLDKNYHKEEIIAKKTSMNHHEEVVSIDDIRKKAFGTLEDELETTLFGAKSILFNDEVESQETDDLFEEMTKEDTIDLDLSDSCCSENNMVLDELDKESPEETELFDLIDSLYEEGDRK